MKIPLYRHNYRGGHQIDLLQSGEPFFGAVEKLIDEAKHFIHFQTYLIDEDKTGIRIIDALIRAAKRSKNLPASRCIWHKISFKGAGRQHR
jgi:phosphatidylserine/phosphatidylglycerophosphate/cardiolipin synthase-like enzyme